MTSTVKKRRFLDAPGPVAVSLCIAGVLVSVFLAYESLSSGTRACLTGADCDVVRESRYSSIAGISVPLLGVAGYLLLLTVTLAPFGKKKKWRLLLPLCVAAVSFSIYLTYLEIFIINALCSWCLISAAISVLLLGIVLMKKKSMYPQASPMRVGSVSMAIFVLVFAVSWLIQMPSAEQRSVVRQSSVYQTRLAKHLSRSGAVMYGSFQCIYCKKQKDLFGSAFVHLAYVECSPERPESKRKLCETKKIKGYPTWEINGKMHEGMLPLQRLEKLSGYGGN